MPVEVDPLHRGARSAEQRPRELALAPGQGEHRPPVVGVGVQVEQPGGREAALDPLEHRRVAALAHVWDCNQQGWTDSPPRPVSRSACLGSA